MQFCFGDRDLEQGVAHMKATAAQNLMHSSLLGKTNKQTKKNTHLSVFKDEMQVPPSGHHGEMKIKRLVEARRLTQARANKELCGSLPQGKDQITRIAHKERGMQNPL